MANPIEAEMGVNSPLVKSGGGGTSWASGFGDLFSGVAGAALKWQETEAKKEMALGGANLKRQTEAVETQDKTAPAQPAQAPKSTGMDQKTMLMIGGGALLFVGILVVGLRK